MALEVGARVRITKGNSTGARGLISKIEQQEGQPILYLVGGTWYAADMLEEVAPTLRSMAVSAFIEAEDAYKDAIETREKISRLLDSVPVDNQALYQRVQRIKEVCTQSINAVWRAKDDIEQLMEELGKEQP